MTPSPTTASLPSFITSSFAWVRRFQVPIGLFIASRVILLAFQAFAISSGGRADAVPWTEAWLRWDTTYYNSIAENGYTFSPEIHSSVVFFPLYPALVRGIAPLTGGIDSAALVVSNLALLGVLMMAQIMAEQAGLSASARTRVLLYFLTYSMAFFLGAGYAESLFLLLTMGSAYYARRRGWAWAISLGMLATVTRVTGVLMLGVIWLEWADSHGVSVRGLRQRETWRALGRGLRADGWIPLLALGIPLALVSFMAYLSINFGDPLAFISGHETIRGSFDLTRTFSQIGDVLTGKTIRLDLSTGMGMLILLPVVLYRGFRVRGAWGWYLLLSALIPLTTGLVSYMRLLGGVFPLYFALSESGLSPRGHAALMGVLVLLQALALWIYFNGSFVA